MTDTILNQLAKALQVSSSDLHLPNQLTHQAYRFDGHSLSALTHIRTSKLDELLGVDRQKNALYANTLAFVQGLPANHALLTGARGSGKSTLVRAMLHAFASEGLKMIEVSFEGLGRIAELATGLRRFNERIILFCDDLSFGGEDDNFRSLKARLDGSLDSLDDNLIIYATSNRRHLLPNRMNDNLAALEDQVNKEVHPGEALDQRLSMGERFGLWLSFAPMDQALYFEIVRNGLSAYDLSFTQEIEVLAARFASMRGGRSGRVAQQFVRQHAGLELLKAKGLL